MRRILNVAASEWIDEKGLTWLETAPKIKLLSVRDARAPYPLTPEEQAALFQELHDHLARMALLKVNTGCHEHELCSLRWDYEVKVPELDTSVFLIPKEDVKNGEERLVVLNRVAKSVVESVRGAHPTYGRRLRAAGVSFEDRQDLLGHKSGRITTHYSRAELSNLIEAAEKVCGLCGKIPATTWLRRRASIVGA